MADERCTECDCPNGTLDPIRYADGTISHPSYYPDDSRHEQQPCLDALRARCIAAERVIRAVPDVARRAPVEVSAWIAAGGRLEGGGDGD